MCVKNTRGDRHTPGKCCRVCPPLAALTLPPPPPPPPRAPSPFPPSLSVEFAAPFAPSAPRHSSQGFHPALPQRPATPVLADLALVRYAAGHHPTPCFPAPFTAMEMPSCSASAAHSRDSANGAASVPHRQLPFSSPALSRALALGSTASPTPIFLSIAHSAKCRTAVNADRPLHLRPCPILDHASACGETVSEHHRRRRHQRRQPPPPPQRRPPRPLSPYFPPPSSSDKGDGTS